MKKLIFTTLVLFLTGCSHSKTEEIPMSSIDQIPAMQEESGQDPMMDDGLSDVERGMQDFASCSAGGGEVIGQTCTSFDGRTFTNPEKIKPQHFVCDDQKNFVLEADGIGAIFFLDGGSKEAPVLLNPVESASGAKYSNGSLTIHTKAETAYIEENGSEKYTNCQQVHLSNDDDMPLPPQP